MNVLVTGGNGQLGRSLKEASAESADRYIFTDVAELDITDASAVRDALARHEVDVVVNCAAYTNVDRAEDDEAAAILLNAGAVGIIADALRERGGFLIHISTDYVFGGSLGNTPRGEDEPANPTGVYGRTKLLGERAVEHSGVRAIVLRTAWLYSEYGTNFVKTMLSLTASRPELNVVFDQAGTPTYARDLADAIVDIISRRRLDECAGTYHYSNEGVCSWYDFAKAIAAMSLHSDCEISPCHSCEFPSKVVRPAYSVLDKTKYKRTFGRRIPYWTDSLRRCIDNLMAGDAAKEAKK